LSGLPKPKAARALDPTDHPGTVTGPGVANVLIEGQPAAVVGDSHTCAFPPPASHPPSAFTPPAAGSSSVRIGGRPAVRTGDAAICGARVTVGAKTVEIGG
jgi:uncharacterized Zn-binding protein involved in type VI secretion